MFRSRWSRFAAAGLLMMLLATGIPGVPAGENPIALRLVVSQPVQTSLGTKWEPLACDGTDIVSGVGNLRMQAFAKNIGTKWATPKFKTKYTSGGSTASPWYLSHEPSIAPGDEILVSDVVQDIDTSLPDHDFSFQWNSGDVFLNCRFEAYNLPPESEGDKSHRTRADEFTDLELYISPYANPDNQLVCGDGRTSSTLRVEGYATAPVTGRYDLHVHQEMEHVIGPNQHGSDIDKRSWEMAMDDVRLVAGERTLVFVARASNNVDKQTPTRHTWHLAQQTAPDQSLNQVFCASDPADNEHG